MTQLHSGMIKRSSKTRTQCASERLQRPPHSRRTVRRRHVRKLRRLRHTGRRRRRRDGLPVRIEAHARVRVERRRRARDRLSDRQQARLGGLAVRLVRARGAAGAAGREAEGRACLGVRADRGRAGAVFAGCGYRVWVDRLGSDGGGVVLSRDCRRRGGRGWKEWVRLDLCRPKLP